MPPLSIRRRSRSICYKHQKKQRCLFHFVFWAPSLLKLADRQAESHFEMRIILEALPVTAPVKSKSLTESCHFKPITFSVAVAVSCNVPNNRSVLKAQRIVNGQSVIM